MRRKITRAAASPRPELRPDTLRFCPLCGRGLARRAVADGREQPVCPGCDFVFYLHPKVAAGALPVAGGRVLLTRRAIEPARGLWTFPGGYVDWGEDVGEAARRETFEEVRLAVRLDGLLGLYSYPGAPVVVAVFLASVPDGVEPVPSPDEVLEAAFFAPEEIPWEALAFPSTQDALRDWLVRRGRGPAPAPNAAAPLAFRAPVRPRRRRAGPENRRPRNRRRGSGGD